MKKCFALISLFLGIALNSQAVTPDQLASAQLLALAQQGVPAESILGVDEHGVPQICGTGLQTAASLVSAGTNSTANLLPAGMRGWECVPNIIRNDGIETFRLEVDVNGPVNSVRFRVVSNYIITQSGSNTITLRDDGIGGDRVGGDYIFTSEPIRYRVTTPMPPYHGFTTNCIPGITMQGAGFIDVVETNNVLTEFNDDPCIGILNTNIPPVQTVMLASNIQASAHFINLQTTNRAAQLTLRIGPGIYVWDVAEAIYSVLPDAFDFISFLSTDKVEFLPQNVNRNYVAGQNIRVRHLFTGTGTSYYNPSITYGSTNRLQAINQYDPVNLGYGDSNYAMHEYAHLWSAHTSTSLGLASGGHYRPNCSAFSTVGGFRMALVTNQNTVYITGNCSGSYTQAPPIDKYMMGLISTSAVPPLYVVTNQPNFSCSDYDYFTNTRPVTISEIVATHGVRTPGPSTAQRHFSICFAGTSYQRLLNSTEMTFYDYVAEYLTRPLPASTPPPSLNEGYVPITKFIEGVTWSSKGLGLIRPTITNMQWATGNFRVDGTGYPGYNRLLASTNLTSWTQVTNKVAGTNGSFSLLDNSQPRPARRWYKVVTP